MSQAPVMPVWTDALIGDTTHLSAEEFGAYFLILMATWRNNGVPFTDNDVRLARIARVPERRWRDKVRPVLAQFFDLSTSTWRQKRLENEWQNVAIKREKSSRAGEESARVRALKKLNTDSTGVVPTLERTDERNANILNSSSSQEGDLSDAEASLVDESEPTDLLAGDETITPHPARSVAERMVAVWTEVCGDILSVPKTLNRERIATCNSRWKREFGQSINRWREFCLRVRDAPWLTGENDRGWRADFDWVLRPAKLIQINEGKYDRRQGPNQIDARRERAEQDRQRGLDTIARATGLAGNMAGVRAGAGDDRGGSPVINGHATRIDPSGAEGDGGGAGPVDCAARYAGQLG